MRGCSTPGVPPSELLWGYPLQFFFAPKFSGGPKQRRNIHFIRWALARSLLNQTWNRWFSKIIFAVPVQFSEIVVPLPSEKRSNSTLQSGGTPSEKRSNSTLWSSGSPSKKRSSSTLRLVVPLWKSTVGQLWVVVLLRKSAVIQLSEVVAPLWKSAVIQLSGVVEPPWENLSGDSPSKERSSLTLQTSGTPHEKRSNSTLWISGTPSEKRSNSPLWSNRLPSENRSSLTLSGEFWAYKVCTFVRSYSLYR